MRNVWKISGVSLLLGGALVAGSLLNDSVDSASVNNTPGTADDPVVTKSYVDQQIQKALGGGGGSVTPPVDGNTPSGGESIKIVVLNPGKRLIANEGTEVIVRSGNAVLYTQDKDGAADLTDGLDLTNGKSVPKNHLISFPRNGRGVEVKSGNTGNLVLMVRGGYVIQ